MDDLIAVQVNDPNTLEDDYMRGLTNGLVVAKACASDKCGLPDCTDEMIGPPEEELEVKPAMATGVGI